GGLFDGGVQLWVGDGGPGPEAGQGAAGLPVDLAVAVVVQAELDPGGVHAGVQADLEEAWGALIAGAQRPGGEELAGGAAGPKNAPGRARGGGGGGPRGGGVSRARA